MSIVESEIRDVQDLRKNVKNNFKKAFFIGYDIKEINNYIETLNSNRLLENTAFLDRIQELETLIKTLNKEKESLETKLDSTNGIINDYELKLKQDKQQIDDSAKKIYELESLAESYEIKLKEKEDAVVFLENENLKQQLAQTTKQRDEFGAECDVLKNDNEFCNKKIQSLENDYQNLAERLSSEMEKNRDLMSEISLLSAKIIEGNSFMNERTIKILEDLLTFNKNNIKETDILTENLKQKLPYLYK